MKIEPGIEIGPHEIVEPLGAGGLRDAELRSVDTTPGESVRERG